MSWETEMDEAAWATYLGKVHSMIEEVWINDPELFFSEFAKHAEHIGNLPLNSDVKQIYLAIAEHCKEIAFNIYTLEK